MSPSRIALALLWFAASVPGCGGGGGGGSSAPSAAPVAVSSSPGVANVLPITVNSGLSGSINLAFASVTLCAPGSSANCQTVDNLILDTGSTGLRIMSSALPAALVLPQQKDTGGNALAECAQFVDGSTWGSVRLADVKIAGELASSLPIQVIGDPNIPAVPSRCAATGPLKNSASNLQANGILGLGVFRQDCGAACAQSGSPGLYYACAASSCQTTAVPVDRQVQNPVAMFASDNNGVIVQLPAVPAEGAASVVGSLVFGIGTQSNNALGNATVITVSSSNARFTTVYKGSTYSRSFVDSGSNGYFFQDTGIPICGNASTAGFYCPSATVTAAATIQGANGIKLAVNFSVANANSLLANNSGFSAFSNLGAPQGLAGSFDWGMPFFYGRSVFAAIEGANTPGGLGPYVAF